LGFLDEVDLSALNSVDGVVFNADVGVETRAEALLFMMDHTQGFEFLEAPAAVASSSSTSAAASASSKSRRGQGGKEESETNLARRRDAMLAMETIVEFIDDHAKLGAFPATDMRGIFNVTAVVRPMTDLLVEAAEELPDAHIGQCALV
jgi:hypothetical protein